jgi:hypothetical protein
MPYAPSVSNRRAEEGEREGEVEESRRRGEVEVI